PHGNLAAVSLPGVPDPQNSSLPTRPTYTYAYDNYGDLLSETDPLAHATMFAYDQLNRKVGETLPLGQSETWTYYQPGEASPGLLKQQTDFDGNEVKYTYDALGRVYQMQTYASTNLTTPDATVTY